MLALHRSSVVFKPGISLAWWSHAYSVTPVSVNIAGTRGPKSSRRVLLERGIA